MKRSGHSPRWAAWSDKPSADAGLQLEATEQWRVEPKVETELGDWTVDKDFAQVLAGGHKHPGLGSPCGSHGWIVRSFFLADDVGVVLFSLESMRLPFPSPRSSATLPRRQSLMLDHPRSALDDARIRERPR